MSARNEHRGTMNILALDTATAACSVALMCDGAVTARRHAVMIRGHAEALMPMVEEVMAEAGAAYAELDLIATTVGPGTFTGLRVGLAAARGLALAGGLPVVGVTTLEALAHGVDAGLRAGRPVVAALDARRGEVYLQCFDGDLVALGAPAARAPGDADLPAGPLVVVGDGAPLVAAVLTVGRGAVTLEPDRLPDAAIVAALAARRFDPAAPPAAPPGPLYLRGSGARPPPSTAPPSTVTTGKRS